MYNPYNPYAYLYPGQQMAQQQPFQPQGIMNIPQMQQPTPQAAQAPQTGPDWIQVPEIQQVEQVQVQPGAKAWVMVQNQPVFALRVADQMGLVNTSYYRFEKIDPSATTAAAPTNEEYVTRQEFQQFVESLNNTGRKTAKREAVSE